MNKAIDWKSAGDEKTVCYCQQVNKGAIVEAIKGGADSVAAIKEATNAGRGVNCRELNPAGRCCHPDIKKIIELYGTVQEDGNCCNGCCSS